MRCAPFKVSHLILLFTFAALPLFIAGCSKAPAVQNNVIYDRKFGTALTLDVHRPNHQNGAAIIWLVSGGWQSEQSMFSEHAYKLLTDHGYTVFAVMHRSEPKYTIPDITDDVTRACRFIRHNATRYGVDKEKIGVIGISSGGHLSLFLGTNGSPGSPNASDPVDAESSKVAAVVAVAPPSDFLNYGGEGKNAFEGILKHIRAAVDFQELNKDSEQFERVADPKKVRQILEHISPIYAVTSDDAPTLIIHGDNDQLVPIEQSERMVEKLRENKVPAELSKKQGIPHVGVETQKAAHTWFGEINAWFDKYLLGRKPS